MAGFYTLLYKELLRFWKVGLQSVFAPMLATLLYLLIFSHVLEEHVQAYPDLAYTVFLIPGLVMMAVLQNAFANSASSLIQSKGSDSIVFVLLSLLFYMDIFLAYVLASVVRGLLVGMGVYLAALIFFEVPLRSLFWVFLFALIGNGLLRELGIIAAIWAEKFDQLAAFQNFAIGVLIRCILYNPFIATFLGESVPFQSFFLCDRRFLLRLLWRFIYFTLRQPCDCGGVLSSSIMNDIVYGSRQVTSFANKIFALCESIQRK